ncbi:BA14K family protein [Martelella alba]|uniref:Lectin-like protein BA14k n=1 Tax=Martelella alba TaxID=2590451 RepID=A0A506U633_9HYPH|nr:BA14K family protein [Martelella alba]TPW28816.1 BA14K family protein [Martelella alba]
MLDYVKKTLIGAVAAAFLAAATVPASAMPGIAAPVSGDQPNIVKVQGPPPGYGGPGRRPPPGPPPHDNWGWNGNAWVPLAALGAGALIIGGAVAAGNNNNNYATSGNGINPRHYQWCEDRYKSYRASDNTYQPYNGPRQQCYSPYY